MTKQPSEGRRTKVALLGCALDTLSLAPFDDQEWNIWASGQWQEAVKRWDVWFELHALEDLPENFNFHTAWMVQQTKPIYVARPTDFAPNGLVFPREPIERKYGKEFLTSTVAWMFAKAIEDGYGEIGIFGCEMACDAEYFYQRPGIKHFQYIAEAQGIKVTIPAKSLLALEKDTYPFCQESAFTRWVAEKDKLVKDELELISAQHNLLAIRIAKNQGAEQVLAMVKRQINWPD